MATKLTRAEMYELVWSTPVKTLAQKFGISDVALRKTCQRAHVPLPAAGHWAKVRAGKRVVQPKLPPRPPGMRDVIRPGAGHSYWYDADRLTDDELLGPIPPEPSFEEGLDDLRDRVRILIGRVTVPRNLTIAHQAIRKLLAEDEARREAQRGSAYTFSWDKPRFQTAFEQRRLRVLNALLLAIARAGGKARLSGRRARDISLSFYDTHLPLQVDSEHGLKSPLDSYSKPTDPPGAVLVVAIGQSSNKARIEWRDESRAKLEASLKAIAVEIVVAAETAYRRDRLRHHQWRIEAKQRKIE